MKKIHLALISVALLLPGTLTAQPRRDERREARHEQVGTTIRDCERRTDEFKVELKRYLDRSRIDGTPRERELNRDAQALEREMNVVREAWDRERDIPRVKRHAKKAIDAAMGLNRTMDRHRISGELQHTWQAVRRDLNRLANVFDLPNLR